MFGAGNARPAIATSGTVKSIKKKQKPTNSKLLVDEVIVWPLMKIHALKFLPYCT
jgi:hypothetical protein